jgi:hypothetical protein
MLRKLATETTRREAVVSRLIMARFWVAWYRNVSVCAKMSVGIQWGIDSWMSDGCDGYPCRQKEAWVGRRAGEIEDPGSDIRD